MVRTTGIFVRAALFLLVVWGSRPDHAAAQAASVHGIVRDLDDRFPLIGANVLLMQVATGAVVHGTATGQDGRYVLDGVAAGDYRLVVRYVGYEEAQVALTLGTGERRMLDVLLEPVAVKLNPVIVSVSRRQEKVLDSPAATTVVMAYDVARDVVPSTVASLRNVVGLDIAQVGLDRYQITLRGFNGTFASRTLTLVDYRRSIFPGLLLNAFSSMPIAPLDVAHVEVVRGPGSALYGGGVEQGVIHFLTKDPFTYPGTTLQVSAGERAVLQGSVRHAGVVRGRLGYKVVASYSRGDDWPFDPSDPDDQPLFATLNDAFEGYDHTVWKEYVMGELAYRFRPRATLTAQAGYSAIKQILYSNVGENQVEAFPTVFGQLRLQAGRTFAFASLTTTPGDNGLLSYRTNRLNIDRSTDLNVQAQHSLDLFHGHATLVAGADVRAFLLDTGGTLHGRNEGDNDYLEGGVYTHVTMSLASDLDLILAGRLDHNSVLDKTVVSPRAALVYKPTPAQRFRFTYNRAFSMPIHGALFLDTIVGDPGLFRVRLRGNQEGWSYPDPLHTTSFLPGLGRYQGVGVPLQAAYQSALGSMMADGTLDAFPDASGLAVLLEGKAAQIAGFSEGRMVLGGPPIDNVPSLDPVKETVTNTVEVGYKGVLGAQVFVSLDAYYTRKEDFVSGGVRITPTVEAPDVAEDLGDVVAGAFSDDELAAFGLSAAELAGLFAEAGAALASRSLGLVETEENYDPDTKPEALVTFINFGDIDFFGLDADVQWRIADRVNLFANYAWVSDNVFDDVDLGEPGTGLKAALNAPKHKVAGGFQYAERAGFSSKVTGRYVDAFDVHSGVRQGRVDGYFVLDVSAGYDFADHVAGLRLDVTAQNLLDHAHRQYVGVPKLGRLILARLTYAF